MRIWHEKNPAPPWHARKAYKRFESRELKECERLGIDQIWEEFKSARRAFNLARVAVANIKAKDAKDLVFKSCIASVFEDGKQNYLRSAMDGCQVIALSVARDTIALSNLTTKH